MGSAAPGAAVASPRKGDPNLLQIMFLRRWQEGGYIFVNPSTAPAWKTAGLKDAQTFLQTVYFPLQ